jgi:hypothetical protein
MPFTATGSGTLQAIIPAFDFKGSPDPKNKEVLIDTTDGDTVYLHLPANALTGLKAGDHVEVTGTISTNHYKGGKSTRAEFNSIKKVAVTAAAK